MDTFNKPAPPKRNRRPWLSPALNVVGTIGEVVGIGGGKLTPMPGDPGEPLKPSGTG
jgi:hypothetical protein